MRTSIKSQMEDPNMISQGPQSPNVRSSIPNITSMKMTHVPINTHHPQLWVHARGEAVKTMTSMPYPLITKAMLAFSLAIGVCAPRKREADFRKTLTSKSRRVLLQS